MRVDGYPCTDDQATNKENTLNIKSIATSTKNAVVTGTLFVTDYAEVGVDKTVRGVKVASVKTVVAVKAHRTAKSDRMVARKAARVERNNAKVIAQTAKDAVQKVADQKISL